MSTVPWDRAVPKQPPEFRLPWVSVLTFLTLRGILLWIVVPATTLVWLLAWPCWHHKKVGCAQLIGWADLNPAAAIQRSLLRPLVRNPLPLLRQTKPPK